MKIIVHLHTTLQQATPQGLARRVQVELPDGATLGDLCAQLGIVVDEENTLLVIDHCHVGLEHALRDGCEVHLIPAIAGG